jgi:hypothetical protein
VVVPRFWVIFRGGCVAELLPWEPPPEGNPMPDTSIDRYMLAKDLPPELRADLAPDARVKIIVQPLTENGFTEDEERAMLADLAKAESSPFATGEEFLAELRRIADEG